MKEETKKSIYELVFGQPDIPITTDVTFTKEGQDTILITTIILSVTLITIFAIAKKQK